MAVRSFYRSFFYPTFQSVCSKGLSILAKARMGVITDSGTAIGLRAKLFNDIIPKYGIGVELGVYKGTLSKFILSINQPYLLHLVDPWWKFKAEWHWAIGDKSTVRSLGALLIALESEIASGKVELHIGTSFSVLEAFEDNYLDWAYVDSTHAYEQTKAELALLKCKVKPGGIIAGDDWRKNPEHKHHGVYRAVQEFLINEPSYRLVFQKAAQWAISQDKKEKVGE